MKSSRLPLKINISLKFRAKDKRYNYGKFIREFPNKSWNRRGLTT